MQYNLFEFFSPDERAWPYCLNIFRNLNELLFAIAECECFNLLQSFWQLYLL